MNAQAILTISTSVVALVTLIKWWGVPVKYSPLVVTASSAVLVGAWAISQGAFLRASFFDYLAALVAVMTSAAGVYGFTRATSDSLTATRSPSNQE